MFWLENLKGKEYLEDIGVDGNIILEWILGKRGEDMDWMHLAQARDQSLVLVDTVMNLQVL